MPAQVAAAPPTLADLAGLLQTFGASLREEIQEVNTANRQEATELRSQLAVLGERVATSLVAPAPAPEETEEARRLRELALAATGAEQAVAAALAEERQAMIAAAAAGGVIEGDGQGGARFVGAVEPSTNVASLTVEQLEALLLGKLSQQQQLDRIDSIPLLETSRDRPEALFRLQRSGELVTTNLLSTAQYALCIPGYSLLPAGTQAQIENSYASTLRIEDVLEHLIAADRGEVKLDLQRAIDVLTEVHELKDERLEGLLERGYVKANPKEGETDATVLERMEEQRRDRMRPARSASFRKDALARREQIKVHKAKLLAQHHARRELAAAGLAGEVEDRRSTWRLCVYTLHAG